MYAACGRIFEKATIKALNAVYYDEEFVGEISDKALDLINKEFGRPLVTTRDVLVNLETMADDGSNTAKEALEFLYKQPNNYLD